MGSILGSLMAERAGGIKVEEKLAQPDLGWSAILQHDPNNEPMPWVNWPCPWDPCPFHAGLVSQEPFVSFIYVILWLS